MHLWTWGGKPTVTVFSNKDKVAGWNPGAWQDKDRSSGKVMPTPILQSWVPPRWSGELAAAAQRGKPWRDCHSKGVIAVWPFPSFPHRASKETCNLSCSLWPCRPSLLSEGALMLPGTSCN